MAAQFRCGAVPTPQLMARASEARCVAHREIRQLTTGYVWIQFAGSAGGPRRG